MKRIIYTLAVMACLIMMMTSADFNVESSSASVSHIKKQHCLGYTVIEAGKGVDCYGDTISLVKQYGFYEIASRSKAEKARDFALN